MENQSNAQQTAAQPAACTETSDKMKIVVLENIGLAEARIKEIAGADYNPGAPIKHIHR